MTYNTVEQLQSLIDNQVDESTTLEYKSSFAKQKKEWKEELAKDVSAMANSNGGTIIYGIREKDGANGHSVPEKLMPIPNSDMSKDQLSQLLSSNIQPAIDGLEITFIPHDDTSGYYVVNVPRSNTAHQNRLTHVYYQRRNATVEAMEDYAIRDIMNRAKTPIIDIEFELVVTDVDIIKKEYPIGLMTSASTTKSKRRDFTLVFRPVNNGDVYVKYLNYFVYIPKELVDSDKDDDISNGYLEIYDDNTIRDLVGLDGMHKKYGPSRYDPILPGLCGRRYKRKILFPDDVDLKTLPQIRYEVHADNAQTRVRNVSWEHITVTHKHDSEVIDPFVPPIFGV